LCYLSGLTRDEAARQLGWSLGTLKRRLEQGRQTLRLRLERRGIPAVGLALSILTPEALQAAVSSSLREATLSLPFSKGAIISPTVAALALTSAGTMRGLAMKLILPLLAAFTLGIGIYASTGQADAPDARGPQPPSPQPDQEAKVVERDEDDPLPAGSTLRFGTSRFRHGIPVSTMAISADGKLAVAVNGHHILGTTRVFDLDTGRALYTLDREGTSIEAAAISPDRRTIVTKQDFSVRIRDAATGKELRKIDLPRANMWSGNEWVAFTPNGNAIAVTSQGKVVHLFDFATGNKIRDISSDNSESSLPSDFSTVLGIAFSQDGKLMASGGYDNVKGHYFARLWDVETGKELRRFPHGSNGYGIRALAISPDGTMLATGADIPRLRLFDVATGKERKVFPQDGEQRMALGSVAFSPDSKTVAAAGASIRLYDVTTGEERLRIDRRASNLRFTDDGKTLTGAVMGAIYRWDTATGKVLTPEAGDSIVEQVVVTADGSRVVTRGQNGDAHLWNAADGRHLRAINAVWQRGLAMSPDGRFLVWAVVDASVTFTEPETPNTTHYGSRLRQYDIAADKMVDRFPGFKGDAQDVTIVGDGKQLITVDHRDGMVRTWDVEAGKEVRSFRAVPDMQKQQPLHVWRTRLSEDGRMLAATYHPSGRGGRSAGGHVRIWDATSGKERHQLTGHPHYVADMAFSPDGRLVVTACEKQCFVWDAAGGNRVAALPDGLPMGAVAVSFSGDGRFLATALVDGAIRLWEVATWTVSREFKGHRDRPTVLTFAPGWRLYSGSVDTTVLGWDIRPRRAPAAGGSLDTAWTELAKQDSGDTFKSVGRFLAAPSETVKWFADNVKPAAPLDSKRVQSWLADLASEEFTVRETADQALRDLDRQAIPYLEQTLKSAESLEVRRRVQAILDQHQRSTLTPTQLRQVRAAMVLELIADGESTALLKRWAAGPPGALLTTEGSAALKRLQLPATGHR
jgi:WD40 repeat protein